MVDIQLDFAYSELKKYYAIVTGSGHCEISLAVSPEGSGDAFEDAFAVDVTGGKGTITGVNARSVLFGVYRLFKHFGYAFLNTGKNGEIPVHIEREKLTLRRSYRPAYKHRGITIEGAVSAEHVAGIIDWLAKNDFNCYFIQFRNPSEFFERWYLHKNNECVPPEPFSDGMCGEFMPRILSEIRKRGLIYHAVGHGWTSEAVGIAVSGWGKADASLIDPDKRKYLAEIGGERAFFEGIPLNTHLCYSKPEVRELLVGGVVRYAEENPDVDVLHFWLADNYNNACECADCKDTLLADYYVEMLNEIDRRLTEKNLPAKVVFLVYLELYWAPVRERIKNPGRFILMFAPIFRTYSKPYADKLGQHAPVPAYARNRVKYSSDVQDYIAFLRGWQAQFSGDSFCFDYHLMWDINRDYSGLALAKILCMDIAALKGLGLDGYLSCQLQRAFFPSGLSMYVMAKMLFDPSLTFEDLKRDYFASAYGKYAEAAVKVFEAIGEHVSYEYLRDELPFDDEKSLKGFSGAAEAIARAETPLLGAEGDAELLPCQSENIRLLHLLCRYLSIVAPLIARNITGGDKEQIKREYQAARALMSAHEAEFSYAYDLFYVNLINDGFVARERKGGAQNRSPVMAAQDSEIPPPPSYAG